MIVDEPSIPECVAATKYEKLGNTYTIKLNSRILCLLDVDTIEKHFTLSNIGKHTDLLHKKSSFLKFFTKR